jgi:hypothetical protein
MIGEGTWKVRGVAAALGMTGTGKEQVAVELEIIEGEPKGQRITWHGYFSDATFDRTIESLRLLGWQGDDLSDLSGIGGLEALVVIEHEEYEGKVRAKAQWINGPGGIALKERLDQGQAAAFAQRMKGKILALNQSKGSASSAGRTPRSPATPHDAPAARGGNAGARDFAPAQAVDDSDIPF